MSAVPSIIERYEDRIRGVLSCYDRVVVQGTLPGLCYARGMTSWMYSHGVRIFDYPKFAEPFRDNLRRNAECLAKEHGVEIQFVSKTKTRKEEMVKAVLERRGGHPGLVHVLSAMEGCQSYRPWHDKRTGRTFLKPTKGKCLHYYFYFVDEELGLCHVRVPTWCPFRLQFCFNGHHQLAAKLDQAGVSYEKLDNAFLDIENFEAAQKLADELDVEALHRVLDRYAKLCCPVIEDFGLRYHWSIMQLEYATDIVFERRSDLATLYEAIVRTAVHAVKAEDVATFLGRKLTGNYQGELGSRFSTRIMGTRIKHRMGPASIKMYDKFGAILRIETSADNVSFFKHHRKVEHKDGSSSYKLAPVRKFVYSLGPLQGLLLAANRRYVKFLSSIGDPTTGIRELNEVTERRTSNGRNYRGFNFFSAEDLRLFEVIVRGEHNISGFRNKDLRQHLRGRSGGQVSRLLKRLRVHGLVKRVGCTYKYYLTEFGRRVVLSGLKMKDMVLIPLLANTAIG